jgi:hypothetical protein
LPNRPFKDSCRWSPTLDQLSLEATAMFYPLVLVADDYGCFDADPRLLLSLCFPLRADRITRAQVEGWRDEMVKAGLIELYGHNDHVYGHFIKWDQHQKPHNTSKRKYPEPKVGTPILLSGVTQSAPSKPTRSHSRSHNLTQSHSVSPPAVAVAVAVEIEDAVAVEVEDEKSQQPSLAPVGTSGRKGEVKTPGMVLFEAYAEAYHRRYKTKPLRNKRVNSMAKQIAERLPHSEMATVADCYLRSDEVLYVRSKHDIALFLRDCEKLWTESKVGRTGVPQFSEKTAGNIAAAEALLAREGMSFND